MGFASKLKAGGPAQPPQPLVESNGLQMSASHGARPQTALGQLSMPLQGGGSFQQYPGTGQHSPLGQQGVQQYSGTQPGRSQQHQGHVPGVLARLQSIVQVNGLEKFYTHQATQSLAQTIDSSINFDFLAASWGMPKELAIDLAALALYDTVILVDDSSSMSFEENGERIEDLKEILSKVAEVATLFDQDGIVIRFLNSRLEGNGIRNKEDAENLVNQVRFQGLTPLAGSMQRNVLDSLVFRFAAAGELQKPVLVITITDGEPTDNPRDAILHTIAGAKRRLAPQYGPKAVAFQFAQVGRDQRAQAFLERLDNHPEVGDIIDCTSYFELEAEEFRKKGVDLTPHLWLVKMMVGAIDPSYDEMD
ncbi:hypothetical protein KFL_001650160 [Klebsormidium nitens]|uniref:VWFA domain-containing protein n=1 Tax=Klebsormidium nitens TaxID=105231 RepID=A0A1Y1I090_KLENI|nr:hypothetical protein KFL_001650160 [Klebsormidium nitens]|eukprot:GAQ83863.1 hypothetical protein KFL_001650160 [Klebsormidium nitens]